MGHAFANGAEAFADALADRLQDLEPAPAFGRMEADALGRTVIDRHEHKRPGQRPLRADKSLGMRDYPGQSGTIR